MKERRSKARYNNRGERELTRTDYDMIAYCINRVRDRIRRRHVVLKPVFADFDKRNCGTVSANEFHQCLTSLGFNFSQDHIEILQWRYTSSRSQDEVDYLAFIRDVDGIGPLSGAFSNLSFPTMKKKEVAKPVAEGVSLEALMYRIREYSLTRRMKLLPFFRDADPLRSNRLTIERFRSILFSNAGLEIDNDETSLLLKAFPHPKDPTRIDYQRFNTEVLELSNRRHFSTT